MSGLARDAFARDIAEARKPKSRRQYAWQHISSTKQAVPYLILRARIARRNSRSWRRYKVGCSLWAYRADFDHIDHPRYGERYRVFDGYNVKETEDAHLQLHAEQMAIEAARAAKYTMILLIVVCAKPQPDDKTGIAGKTLRPCKDCRRLMCTCPIVFNRTHVLTITPDRKVRELFTRRVMMKMFKEVA